MDRSNPCMAVLDKWWNSSGELSMVDFRGKLDMYSLFAERNILVSESILLYYCVSGIIVIILITTA